MKVRSGLPLFRSPQQERLLAELFVFAEEPLSLSQLAHRTGASIGGVHKEVERLERSGLVTSRTSGRSRLVEPNRFSPVFSELRSLLVKTMGPEPLLREALAGIDGVREAFIFGSWADPDQMAPVDIDLLVIGDPDPGEVYDAVSAVETRVGRPIDVVLRSQEEWAGDDGGFARTVRSRPRIPLT